MKEPTFPSAPQALLVVLALLMVEFLIGATLRDLRRPLGLSDDQVTIIVMLLGNALVIGTLMQRKGLTLRELMHPSASSVTATAGLLVVPVALVLPILLLVIGTLVDAIAQWLPMSRWEQQMFEQMMQPTPANLLVVCVLAPLCEELLFRGLILRAFLLQYPRGQAIGWSALIFGLAHFNIYQFVSAFVMGVLAGWLYERSRSLVPCIALHGLGNACLMALQSAGDGADDADAPAWVWVLALLAAALGARALRWLLAGRLRGAEARESGRS